MLPYRNEDEFVRGQKRKLAALTLMIACLLVRWAVVGRWGR